MRFDSSGISWKRQSRVCGRLWRQLLASVGPEEKVNAVELSIRLQRSVLETDATQRFRRRSAVGGVESLFCAVRGR
jgi:hypothetical protein